MHRWLAALVFAACLLAAQGAQALGLGEITTRSALNEPMDAEIALLGATPDELTTLEVRLASRDTFDRYGIDKPGFLNNFRFKLRGGPNPAIEITSSQPVTDPFVTMLVEAVWPRGRLLREYTVLLDPPTYAAPQAQTTQPAPVRRTPPPQRETRSSGAVQRSSAPAPVRLEGDQYRVQRNDTLWEIAERVRPDESVSINQVMLAIFEANPGNPIDMATTQWWLARALASRSPDSAVALAKQAHATLSERHQTALVTAIDTWIAETEATP